MAIFPPSPTSLDVPAPPATPQSDLKAAGRGAPSHGAGAGSIGERQPESHLIRDGVDGRAQVAYTSTELLSELIKVYLLFVVSSKKHAQDFRENRGEFQGKSVSACASNNCVSLYLLADVF